MPVTAQLSTPGQLLGQSASTTSPALTVTDSPTPAPAATFRAQVNMVSMAAVVRDEHGRAVASLGRADFDVRENGHAVPILEVRSEHDAPANVALLVDGSGSMRVGDAIARARDISARILANLDRGRDEAALYTFDTRILTVQEFTHDFGTMTAALARIRPWGSTSLYDAIGGVSGKIRDRAINRRAMVVLTDGADTTSQFSAAEAGRIASTLDVPVYVFALDTPRPSLRPASNSTALSNTASSRTGASPHESPLAHLARTSGGAYFVATDAASTDAAITQLLDELRHQHVIAFEASSRQGWRSVELKVRRPGLTVRARGGYQGGATPSE